MCFIRHQCSEADRLDELFSEVREKARLLAMTGQLSKIDDTQLEQQEYSVLNQISDHQTICGCARPI
jgi:hypothetical protein